jgi:branched-chain amino acid transport system ATP-binding protein
MTIAIEKLAASYRQGQHVLADIDLTVDAGRMVLVLGHNGAGKTTLLNCIYGIHNLSAGQVTVDGQPLAAGTHSRIGHGIAFIPSEHACFMGLTVMENLQVAASVAGRDKTARAQAIENAVNHFPVLKDKRVALAGSLSGGQRRMLAVGMAIAQQPRYLLMDEPSLGLAPRIVEDLYESIATLRAEMNLGVIVVEQSVNPTLLRADAVHVIRTGRQVFSGTGEEFAQQDLWELL